MAVQQQARPKLYGLTGYVGVPFTEVKRKTAGYEFNRLDSEIEMRGKELVDPHTESHCLGIERDSIGQLEIVNKAEKAWSRLLVLFGKALA